MKPTKNDSPQSKPKKLIIGHLRSPDGSPGLTIEEQKAINRKIWPELKELPPDPNRPITIKFVR